MSIGLLPALFLGFLGFQIAALRADPISWLGYPGGKRDPLALGLEQHLLVPLEVAVGASCALLIAAWRWYFRSLFRRREAGT